MSTVSSMSVQERRYLRVKTKKDEKRLQKALGNSTDCSTDVQQQLLHSWGEQLHTPLPPPPTLEEFRATMFREAAENRLKAQVEAAKANLQQKKQRVEYLEQEAEAAAFALTRVEGDNDPLTNEFRTHWQAQLNNTHAYQIARNEMLAAQEELDDLE